MPTTGSIRGNAAAFPETRPEARLDVTARSIFALVEPGSCFAGTLFELALAADRSYMLAGGFEGYNRPPPTIALSALNTAAYPTVTGLSRRAGRFLGEPDEGLARVEAARNREIEAEEAEELGLVTVAPDDIDWEDEDPHGHRGTRQPSLPTPSPAWRRACVSPGRNHGHQDLRPPLGLAELDLPAPERRRRDGALTVYGSGRRSAISTMRRRV